MWSYLGRVAYGYGKIISLHFFYQMYIVFEWVVGTGKSTQSKRLVEYMQHCYPDKHVHLVREPWWTSIAEEIRNLVQWKVFDEHMHALTDIYLYAAARAQLLQTVVRPALAKWSIVIADRSICSSLAYQWWAQWYGIQKVWDINQYALKGCIPDCILWMDMAVEAWCARTFDEQGDKWERMDLWFFHKVYAWYHQLSDFSPLQWRIKRVDAHGSVEDVWERVKTNFR